MPPYRARWACPQTGRPKERFFHSKPEAERFRDLPRDNIVFVEPYKEPKDK